ncbi:MAG: dihydroorotate dehydrogenase-like protein [Candidatus Latescibacteria bacterium]|nr:dihydroorotate dehydrogenase-like protein [bacterium]MBD3423621.1 dihydroorotate dehydrogenase-like protein [Candidatus Latescibacterota bacterium]
MDLSTEYMGLTLKNPLIVSSCDFTRSTDNIIRIEQAGGAAVVLKSLFEEQLAADSESLIGKDDRYFYNQEALDYINRFSREHGIEEYLKLIRESREETSIPVIASVNCITSSGWTDYARRIEDAGADGLELNISSINFNPMMKSEQIERIYLDIVGKVKESINIPLSVKMGFFFTNLYSMIRNIDRKGVSSVVMFNRNYRPDIDIEKLEIDNGNIYSAPEEITLSLRWIALLSKDTECSLIGATGIHDGAGVIKQLLAGASAVQICTTLYKNEIPYIGRMLEFIEGWMEKKKYERVDQFRGKIANSPELKYAFERIQFIRKVTGDL